MIRLVTLALFLVVSTLTASAQTQTVLDAADECALAEVRSLAAQVAPPARPEIVRPTSFLAPPGARPPGARPPAASPRADGGPDAPSVEGEDDSIHWWKAVGEASLYLGVQHTFRFTELKTRRELDGPWLNDWFDAVKSTHGWDDGGRQFTNYVAHPMEGALYGYTLVQNDPKGKRLEFENSKRYWKSRMKAMGWAALWSTQFELGPVSQASIGNVGAGEFEAGKMAYVDLVVTPTIGTAWMVTEDAVDRYLVQWIERRTSNRIARNFARMALNPMRSCANLLRFKPFWYRDSRL